MTRLPGEEDDELLELPPGSSADDDGLGVEDAEELLFNDLEAGPEDVGLDTELVGISDGLAALLLDDLDEDDARDDRPIEVESDIDAEGEEQGWTEDNEGTSAANWDDELPDELADEEGDDGGEEGVDDPLLDGLPEVPDRPGANDDDDDDEKEGIEDDGLDDLAREIGADT